METNNIDFIDMSVLAEKLVGDTVSANIMMLGYVSQRGLLPISKNSLEKAIELNGVAIQQNLNAFNWGRLLADRRNDVYKNAGFVKTEKKVKDIISIHPINDQMFRFLFCFDNPNEFEMKRKKDMKRILELTQGIPKRAIHS